MPKLKDSGKDPSTIGRHDLANQLLDQVPNLAPGVGKIKAHQRALEIVDAVFEVIQEELALSGGRVVLTGFGTFTARPRSARRGTTGFAGAGGPKTWSRPAGVSVRFSQGKLLSNLLND